MAGELSLKTPSTGLVTLVPTDTATDKTITLPATTGTMVVQDSSNITTVENLAVTNVTASGTVNVGGGNISPQTGFKNRIINGGMTIDQRNAGASVSVATAEDKYPVDRFFIGNRTGTGVFSGQQSTTAPSGFKNSLIVTTTTANASLGASEYGAVRHIIEGLNVADLGWGTASAQPITISFWVRSSLTGTFGASLVNGGFNRSYPFTYTISAANTYEYKTVTIAGDTSGTWATDNTAGVNIFFGLGAGASVSGTAGAWAGTFYYSATGATSVVGTSGATFYITGVQLEKGSTATPFEFRSIGQELALCQRYYSVVSGFSGYGYFSSSSASLITTVPLPVTMRATPTITITSSGSLTAGFSTAVYGTSGLTAFSYQVISNAAATGGSLLASATAAIEL